MRSFSLLLAASALGGAACGLSFVGGAGPSAADAGADAEERGDTGALTGPASGPAGSGLATGLPCDVQAVVENRCIACHGGTTDAPPLRTYEDFVAQSTRSPTLTRAASSVDLLKRKLMPPPPAAPPEADEIASFEDWVAAGTPRLSAACTDPPLPPAAAGLADAGGACTSGKLWTKGNEPSPLMHPGAACNACHQVAGGPNLRIAGTVFRTLHEPNDCIGGTPPAQLSVIITDSKNNTFTLPVNDAGNFASNTGGGPPPRAPFKARISDGTKVRLMNGTVTSGDCNSCHSAAGINGAPGRVLAP